MAKSKTPFFSIGSRGTVGGVLTSQRRGGVTILRQTPVPTDPYSLAQAYQRWDYKDYAYLWTLLSNSEKQVYRTVASRYHITGFSYWMRLRLKELTNLAGRWHLDEKGGAVAYDSSRNLNHGTIFGATPAPGVIDGAFYFDGLNDYVNCGNDPSLQIDGETSIAIWVRRSDLGVHRTFIAKYHSSTSGFLLWTAPPANKVQFYLRTSNVLSSRVDSDIALPVDEWVRIIAQRDANNDQMLYLNRVKQADVKNFATSIKNTTEDLHIGHYAALWMKRDLDDAILRTRSLDQTEIDRDFIRRYPA